MTAPVFLDTNILVYAAAGKKDDPRKHAIASEIVLTRSICLSGQVLAEFYEVSQRARIALSAEEVEHWFDFLEEFPIAVVDAALVRTGVLYSRRYQISYWDGAILAAAHRLNAAILYSEDLSHEQTYGSVRVVNPFRSH